MTAHIVAFSFGLLCLAAAVYMAFIAAEAFIDRHCSGAASYIMGLSALMVFAVGGAFVFEAWGALWVG